MIITDPDLSSATHTLSMLTAQQHAHIHAVQTDKTTRIRLLSMGIGKGSRIEVLHNRQGDMVLSQGNNRISLGSSVTSQIAVYPLTVTGFHASDCNQLLPAGA